MGQSTDAILAFGFHQPEWEGSDNEMIECIGSYLARKDGLKGSDYENGYIPYKVYSKYERDCPVEIIQHCSCDYPMYFISVRGYSTDAGRGRPHDFECGFSTRPSDDEILRFKSFCDDNNIEFAEPKWSLFSNWC